MIMLYNISVSAAVHFCHFVVLFAASDDVHALLSVLAVIYSYCKYSVKSKQANI